MPTITKKEYEEYKKLCYDRDHGRFLTPDGLRLLCEGLNRDPELIGKHMLETLEKMRRDNPIIRVADDVVLPSEYIQETDEITLDMLRV